MEITLEEKLDKVLNNQEMILSLFEKNGISPSDSKEPEDQKCVFTPTEAHKYLQKYMKISMTTFKVKVRKGLIKTAPIDNTKYLKPDLDKFIKNPS